MSCVSATAGTAAGSGNTGEVHHPQAADWNGAAWTAPASIPPPSVNPGLLGLSGTAPAVGEAVGYSVIGEGRSTNLAEGES